MVSIQEIFLEIAVLVFSVSFGIYFLRTITEWPLSIRFMRYFHRLGFAYQYGKKEIFYSFIWTIFIYLLGLVSFGFSLLAFTELTQFSTDIIDFKWILNLLAISICIIAFLLVPSFFLHLTRGILQLIPSTAKDFVLYARNYAKIEPNTRETQTDAELGIRRGSMNIICNEIENGKKFNRFLRVFISILLIIILFAFPWIFRYLFAFFQL